MDSADSFANDAYQALHALKRKALWLLIAMCTGFLIAHAMGGHGIWEWVGAFCEAATIGGFADWFAVVALFRRPMGLPIPHTAILPHNKIRLAQGIAHFVGDHFLKPTTLVHKMRDTNLALRLGQWLSHVQHTEQLTRRISHLVLVILKLMNRPAIRQGLHHWVQTGLSRWNAATMIADLFNLLTVDGHHQHILDIVLKRIGHWLNNHHVKAQASALIVRYARREWPTFVGTVNWVKPVGEIGDRLAEQIARAALDELQEILTTPDHRLRKHYERWVLRYIHRMRHDAAVIAHVNALKQQAVEHPALQAYAASLLTTVIAKLSDDLNQPNSRLLVRIERGLRLIGTKLETQLPLQHGLNVYLLRLVKRMSVELRQPTQRYITDTINHWDDTHLVNQIEQSIGRDLQYIRFNGTLVGGCIGLALHAASAWISV